MLKEIITTIEIHNSFINLNGIDVLTKNSSYEFVTPVHDCFNKEILLKITNKIDSIISLFDIYNIMNPEDLNNLKSCGSLGTIISNHACDASLLFINDWSGVVYRSDKYNSNKRNRKKYIIIKCKIIKEEYDE